MNPMYRGTTFRQGRIMIVQYMLPTTDTANPLAERPDQLKLGRVGRQGEKNNMGVINLTM